MTTPMRSRMRRQTRPANYMSRSCQAEPAAWNRPGSCSFSFTGEFPGMTDDQQPVEATSRRRDYTAPGRNTGAYRAVGQEDTRRIPVISKYGLRFGAAMLAFVLLLGMIDSAGVEVRTLQAPLNADITLAEQALPYTLASIWGQ